MATNEEVTCTKHVINQHRAATDSQTTSAPGPSLRNLMLRDIEDPGPFAWSLLPAPVTNLSSPKQVPHE